MASIAAHMNGDPAHAGRLLAAAEAIADAREDDYLARVAVLQARSLGGLMDGDLDRVVPAASLGVTLGGGRGDLYTLATMHANLGLVALIRGEFDRCRPLLTEALRLARRIDDRVAQHFLLGALAGQAAGDGRCRLAAALLGAAEALQSGLGASVLPFVAPWMAQARQSAIAALGMAAYKAEFEAGSRLGREEALALALGEAVLDGPVLGGPMLDGSMLGGSMLGGPAPIVDRGAGPLGERQFQVARLIADGLSNKQIAVRLLISQHTVDTHIRNIMTRLGCRSRAQIAAWVASERSGSS